MARSSERDTAHIEQPLEGGALCQSGPVTKTPLRITVTGTGTPIHRADRAGPGVLVEYGDIKLQFDAGRATVMRLAAAGSSLTDLTALFVTHHHSDHVVGLPDLVMTRWLNDINREGQSPLPIFAPAGEAVRLISRLLDPWVPEMQMRQEHTRRPNIATIYARSFEVGKAAAETVAEFGEVSVGAIAVDHEPVVPAVAYRVDTPVGSVVISGDTAVCSQVRDLAEGADVLVHEVILASRLEGLVTDPARLLEYHSEPAGIGELANAAGVNHLVLTHLVPAPETAEDRDVYEQGVRAGGFTGRLSVADDLWTTTVR